MRSRALALIGSAYLRLGVLRGERTSLATLAIVLPQMTLRTMNVVLASTSSTLRLTTTILIRRGSTLVHDLARSTRTSTNMISGLGPD